MHVHGYHCYAVSCGISATADYREHGKPVLFGVYLIAPTQQSRIPSRSILCAKHLRQAIANCKVVHYRPLDEMLVVEGDVLTRNLIAEQLEKAMNRRGDFQPRVLPGGTHATHYQAPARAQPRHSG
jgi:hypothetical protein